MAKYILSRLLATLISLVIIITVVFLLLRQLPVEGYFDNFDKLSEAAVESQLRSMGLKDPLIKQLFNFFAGLFRGDLGESTRYRVKSDVVSIIADKIPISMKLGLISMGVALVLGIPLGGAMSRSKIWDKLGTVFIVFVNAVPAAIYFVLIQLYGTEIMGIDMLFKESDYITWVLPVLTMSLGNIAYYAMWLRRYMMDEMTKDYIKLARAKGVPMRRITMKHVLRNSFVPMIQYLPSSILYTISGSIYIESLYSIPGMGGLLVEVIGRQDNPLTQALVIIYSCIGIVGLLIGDILMSIIDPRIKFTKKEGAR